MGFNITFYKFNKEGNSTKRPSSSGTTYNCRILRGSSIVSPSIELSIGVATAPDFNYAYIPNFNRYYYVSEWTYNEALWKASLEVDALATYRTEIGSEPLYALRTSNPSLYDGSIVDNLYPTKTGCILDREPFVNPWKSPSEGLFVLGIVGREPSFGSLSYFALEPTEFRALVYALTDDTIFTDPNNHFDLNELSLGLTKSIVDPLQYIKSCVFIPRQFISGDNVTDIDVFNWNVSVSGKKIRKDTPYESIGPYLVTIPKHPQTSTRGVFVNQAPYSVYTLSYPPFGVIDIDSTILANKSLLYIDVIIDYPTGLGTLIIYCKGDNDEDIVLNKLEAQIGVPVSLSQVTRDYIGGATAILQGIGGIVSGAMGGGGLVGGLVGGFKGVGGLSGIGNAINSLTPRSQTIGTGGSYSQLYTPHGLYAQFFECVDDDIAKNGRPCCKVVNCSSGGYFLIQDGDVSISGTKAEWEMIKNQLEEGFYWE